MRVMVTGANGFVGTQVVRSLIGDHEVLAVDCLRYGPLRFTPAELPGCSFEELDLRDADRVAGVMADFGPEAVIHLAAIHFIPECERDPLLAISTNLDATANVAMGASPGTRLVLASSAAVYEPSLDAHREDDAVRPLDIYGFSKLWAEQLVTYLAGVRHLEAVLIRLFNVVGPGETNPHLVPELITQLKGDTTSIKLGNTTPKRDYIYVDDAAAAFVAAALRPLPPDESVVVANVGTGRSWSVTDVVATLSQLAGRHVAVEVDPAKLRAVDRPELRADPTRMDELFGWRAQVPFEEAMARTWRDPRITTPVPSLVAPALAEAELDLREVRA